MKRSQYSGYENYILLCGNSRGFKSSYMHFLNFSEVSKFIKHIANIGSETFSYKGTIYNKRIKSSEAQRMVDSLSNHNKCDYGMFRLVATQLKVQI